MNTTSMLASLSMVVACSSEPAASAPDASPPADVSSSDAAPGDTARDVAAPPGDSPTTDAGAACGRGARDQCNVVTNEGCGAGMGCYQVNTPVIRNACRTAGRAGWDEACTTNTDCREGFVCIQPGRCTKLCCGDDNASCRDESRGGRAGSRCALELNDSGGLKLCVGDSGCDPFATTGNRCPMDSPRCEPVGESAMCRPQLPRTTCTPGGDGTPCCQSGCCLPGFLCVVTGGGACDMARPNGACRRTCNTRLTNPDSVCPMGQRCVVQFNVASGLPSYFRACGAPAM